MRNMHHLLVVVVLWTAAATHSYAAGQNFYAQAYTWNGQPVTQQVDGSYATEHPEQVGLQGVVASNRDRIEEVEEVNAQQWAAINSQPKVVVVGVAQPVATPAPVVVTPPAQPAPAPSGAPAGGPATNQPATPAGGNNMPDFMAVLGFLGIAGVLVWIAVVLGQRNRENTLGTYLNGVNLFNGAFRGFHAGADGSCSSFVGALADPAFRPNAGGQAAAPNAPALPAATPTNLQSQRAQVALAAYAPPLADPAGTNLDVLTQAMISNGIDGSVPALVAQQLALLVGTGQVS